MRERVIIDGNNLLHALREHGPIGSVGRETMVRMIERWSRQKQIDVTVVFDGPPPKGGLAQQMSPAGMTVRFSAPATADDLIVSAIQDEKHPASLRIISSDSAIRHAAGYRKCRCTNAASFIAELFPTKQPLEKLPTQTAEKPVDESPDEADRWKTTFGGKGELEEPFDGSDAMIQ